MNTEDEQLLRKAAAALLDYLSTRLTVEEMERVGELAQILGAAAAAAGWNAGYAKAKQEKVA